MRIVQSLALLAALAVPVAAMATPIAFSSTGVGTVGSVDSSWTITVEPAGTAPSSTQAIISDGIPGRLGDTSGRNPLGRPHRRGTRPQSPRGPTFTPPPSRSPQGKLASASLVGGWASDNESFISLNGVATGDANSYASSYPYLDLLRHHFRDLSSASTR